MQQDSVMLQVAVPAGRDPCNRDFARLDHFGSAIWGLCERMTATASLNILDELYMHLDREDEPWSVHIEAQVEGSIDPERLLDAVREAARRHPIARARLGES